MIGGSAGFGGNDGGSASSSFQPLYVMVGVLKIFRFMQMKLVLVRSSVVKKLQLGGADVKNGTRMGMNSKIDGEYCGTKIGLPTVINNTNQKKYYGLYVVGKNDPILIEQSNVQQFFDRPIMVHSPAYCASKGDAYCKTCIGKTWSLLKNGVTNTITNIGDVYMYDKMKRMHGKALKTATFVLVNHIFVTWSK